MMTVKEYFEKNTPHSLQKEKDILKYMNYIAINYDDYLLVAKHRDGRYFVVDYNGDLGIDDTNRDLIEIVEDWYTKAN
ncbi:hypothetical protein ACFL27_17740 [candidate division CSSED10-310 bacterium]|uniref:Phage protein n=1 Tax=candidate division CSSED10-310 bacterium TaxID=2855610 RepID=A0ABV6Z0Q3_UNCC1